MVKSKSNSRLSTIKKQVILTQTDTTVGFISQNNLKLQEIKQRENSKPFIIVFSSFKNLLDSKYRIPSAKKNLVRRSSKTSFIVKNKSFRVAPNPLHSQILRDLQWNYSTSANENGKKFNLEFCEDKTDIIIEDKDKFSENKSSNLFKINNIKKVRIR